MSSHVTAAAETGREWHRARGRETAGGRLLSLDVFRGVTVAGMILVTDPGTYSAVYRPLRHAEWAGATATDMIFPSFLFVVGVSITMSFASRIARGADRAKLAGHVLRRSAILLVLGLAVNGFPDYEWHTLRWPGVLQRIGLCYLCCGLLYLVTHRAGDDQGGGPGLRRALLPAGAAVGLLAAYWAMLRWVPAPGIGAGYLDSYRNLPAYVDRALLGTRHMWAYGVTPGMGVTYDPEGSLSTVPAIATTIFGLLAGEWMRSGRRGGRKALGLAAAGAVLVLLGWSLSAVLPINKRIWTSTFALLSGGVSLLLFSMFYAVMDLLGDREMRARRMRWWAAPALVLGTNAILAFVLSGVLTTLSDRIRVYGAEGSSLTLHQWGYQHLFATWMAPIHASLAYAVMVVMLNIALIVPLYRRRIFLRI